jgi:hypothetical protein
MVRMDPRVKTPPAVLAAQFTTAMRLAALLRESAGVTDSVRALRKQLAADRQRAAQGAAADSLATYDQKLGAIEGGGGGRAGGSGNQPTLASVNAEIAQLYEALEQADAAPSAALAQAIRDVEQKQRAVLSRWRSLPRR